MTENTDLLDITEQIIPEESLEIYQTCIHLMEEFIADNPKIISEPDFDEIFDENIQELMHSHFDFDIFYTEESQEEMEEIIEHSKTDFFKDHMPPRSYPDTIILEEPDHEYVSTQLDILRDKPQPTQRTKEWYEFRHNLITASNAFKAFGTQSVQNQLIYEKCLPISLVTVSNKNNKPANVDTAMHWGQKFEPVSVMYYEYMYQTKVSDFGCIQHPKYSYLGASPDGIMSNPDLPRYGRMLEIKNIVNRDIDGIPKKEYWIQMQLQMETCNLDECDFLETRFVEYPSSSEYYLDKDKDTDNSDIKGIIMYFSTDDGKPIYIYKPLCMSQFHFDNVWENEMMEKYSMTLTWIRNIYWKLDEVSCVLVLRNRRWFHDNLETLSTIWTTILTERNEGYSHRAPNKKVKSVVEGESESGGGYLGNKMRL